MEKRIRYTVYADAADITYIMEDIFDASEELLSTECVGWYYGEPTDTETEQFTGNLIRVYA